MWHLPVCGGGKGTNLETKAALLEKNGIATISCGRARDGVSTLFREPVETSGENHAIACKLTVRESIDFCIIAHVSMPY